jgi:pantetheine-phosphate adenylyltransferase
MKRCVYAGSFDPITNGHLWMIEQGSRLVDELVVAVGVNPDKAYTFPLADRLALLDAAARGFPNVRVESFANQYLVRYAKSIGAAYVLRGIRTTADYEFERAMRQVNGDLEPGIATVFLMPPREIAEISSSFVKGLVGPAGWESVVKQYVPEGVYRKLIERFAHGPTP